MKQMKVVAIANGRWVEIGSAIVRDDGGIAVRLDVVPLKGELHIVETYPTDEPKRRGPGRARSPSIADEGI